VRHLQFAEPVTVLMNGHKSQGMILKPEPEVQGGV